MKIPYKMIKNRQNQKNLFLIKKTAYNNKQEAR